jgi:hypothetical protein
MAVVKLTKKEDLDQLIATLVLRIGKKITQQDVLDACVNLGITHMEELEAYFGNKPNISKKRLDALLNSGENFDYDSKGSIDEDLYGA